MSPEKQTARSHSREPLGKPWRHPTDHDIQLPSRVAATIALMGMGLTDFTMIASLVGLTVEQVRSVDEADDPAIRKLAVVGIPSGGRFKLRGTVRCPKCHGNVSTVPCVTCSTV